MLLALQIEGLHLLVHLAVAELAIGQQICIRIEALEGPRWLIDRCGSLHELVAAARPHSSEAHSFLAQLTVCHRGQYALRPTYERLDLDKATARLRHVTLHIRFGLCGQAIL